MTERLQTLWIDGREQTLTPRQEIRLALRAGRTMNEAERDHGRGLMSRRAFDRFERIFAVSTATEHRLTRSWPLERWIHRSTRARNAVRAIIAH